MSRSHECPSATNCEVYRLFRSSASLGVWRALYCTAEYDKCARYQLSERGRRVPVNLMPNGTFLKGTEVKKGPGEEPSGTR